jgi:hypothetical protein
MRAIVVAAASLLACWQRCCFAVMEHRRRHGARATALGSMPVVSIPSSNAIRRRQSLRAESIRKSTLDRHCGTQDLSARLLA